MRIFVSLLLALQFIITPAWAQSVCKNPGTPLSSKQTKEVKTLVKAIQCQTPVSDVVLTEVMGSCLIEVIKGAFEFLVAQIEGLWDLLELGYDLAKKFGSFTVEYLKAAWNGTLPTFWAEQYHQGASFFSNIAKTIKSIPKLIVDFFQKESEKFRCMATDKKVDYICHAVGRVGPEVMLIAMGIWKGPSLAESIMPKLVKVVDAEKAIAMKRAINIKKIAKANEIKTATKRAELVKTISHHPRKVEAFEYKEVGKVVKDAKDFKNLDEGAHLYVIDSKGNVATTPRFPDVSGKAEEVLANHPALKEKLAKTAGDHDVVAAGEFYVDGGEIAEINNKSGRFQGSADHLDHAVETLKRKGLQVKSETKVRDMDALEKEIKNGTAFRDPEHIKEKEIANLIKERFGAHPEYEAEFSDFKKTYKAVYQNPAYKSAELGKVDSEKIVGEILTYMDKHPEKTNAAMGALYYLNDATKESSRHFKGFLGLTNGSFSAAERKESLELMKNMAEHGTLP